MLLRNLDSPKLCNGRQRIIKPMMLHILEAVITTENMLKSMFSYQTPIKPYELAFNFMRLHFPVLLSFFLVLTRHKISLLKMLLNLGTVRVVFSYRQFNVG